MSTSRIIRCHTVSECVVEVEFTWNSIWFRTFDKRKFSFVHCQFYIIPSHSEWHSVQFLKTQKGWRKEWEQERKRERKKQGKCDLVASLVSWEREEIRTNCSLFDLKSESGLNLFEFELKLKLQKMCESGFTTKTRARERRKVTFVSHFSNINKLVTLHIHMAKKEEFLSCCSVFLDLGDPISCSNKLS